MPDTQSSVGSLYCYTRAAADLPCAQYPAGTLGMAVCSILSDSIILAEVLVLGAALTQDSFGLCNFLYLANCFKPGSCGMGALRALSQLKAL